jgi:hypothetical protein
MFAECSSVHAPLNKSKKPADRTMSSELFALFLNGETLSSFGPPAAQDTPAALGGHTHKKTVGSLPLGVAECGQVLFHQSIPGTM